MPLINVIIGYRGVRMQTRMTRMKTHPSELPRRS